MPGSGQQIVVVSIGSDMEAQFNIRNITDTQEGEFIHTEADRLVGFLPRRYVGIQISVHHVTVDRVAAVPQGTAVERQILVTVVLNGQAQLHIISCIFESSGSDFHIAFVHQHSFFQGSRGIELDGISAGRAGRYRAGLRFTRLP